MDEKTRAMRAAQEYRRTQLEKTKPSPHEKPKSQADWDKKAALPRDEKFRWLPSPPPSKPWHTGRLTTEAPKISDDWEALDFDLSIKEIVVVDQSNGETMVYRRKQKSGEVECLWVSNRDMVEPIGHTSRRLGEMWDKYKVYGRFTAGWEPPHVCVEGCAFCKAMKKREE